MQALSRGLSSVTSLLRGRWQIPLGVVAIAIATYAIQGLREAPPPPSFDSLLADVDVLVQAGQYKTAIDAVANLLEMEPPRSRPEQAKLHELLADIVHKQERVRGTPIPANVELLLDHHKDSLALGRMPSAAVMLRTGEAYEWAGELVRARNAYRAVLDRDPKPSDRRAALAALVRLLDEFEGGESERRGYIEALLAEQGGSDAQWWATMLQALEEALDRSEFERAGELLEHYASRFLRSDLEGYHSVLHAWLLVEEGRYEEAIARLDWIDAWIDEHPKTDAGMDAAGYLPAIAAWLRGRVELGEGRPQQALNSFGDSLALQASGVNLIHAMMGQADAYAQLERDLKARETMRACVGRLRHNPRERALGRAKLMSQARRLSDARAGERAFKDAVAYLVLAIELTPTDAPERRLALTEQLAELNATAAEETEDATARAAFHRAAAAAFQKTAELGTLQHEGYATWLWNSAQHYDQGGQIAVAREMLRKFVNEQTLDKRLPAALLQLGQSYAADGLLDEALAVYGRLAADYPRQMEAFQARVQSADCLIAKGADEFPQAGRILTELIEGGELAPEAQVYRDALYALGDLLYQQREYSDAISRIEDFLDFYPNHEERLRLLFLLADSYRLSAYALRNTKLDGDAAQRALDESRVRFRASAKGYEQFLDESRASDRDFIGKKLLDRLALMNRADALLAQGDPGAMEDALATYRQVTAYYQGEPAALAAQVQISNIFVRQGRIVEAARELEKARWLLRNIPDAMFRTTEDGLDRKHWDEYLNTLLATEMFRQVFDDAT